MSTAEKRRSTGGKRMSASGMNAQMETMKLTQEPVKPAAESAATTEKPQKQDKERKDQKSAAKSQQQAPAKKKQEGPELIGITCSKLDDLSEWYQQVILKGEMLEFTDIPGCYIYQPGSYRIWEFIQNFFNERIRKMKVKNCYFPLFITEANLQREKEHMLLRSDFAIEANRIDHCVRGGHDNGWMKTVLTKRTSFC